MERAGNGARVAATVGFAVRQPAAQQAAQSHRRSVKVVARVSARAGATTAVETTARLVDFATYHLLCKSLATESKFTKLVEKISLQALKSPIQDSKTPLAHHDSNGVATLVDLKWPSSRQNRQRDSTRGLCVPRPNIPSSRTAKSADKCIVWKVKLRRIGVVSELQHVPLETRFFLQRLSRGQRTQTKAEPALVVGSDVHRSRDHLTRTVATSDDAATVFASVLVLSWSGPGSRIFQYLLHSCHSGRHCLDDRQVFCIPDATLTSDSVDLSCNRVHLSALEPPRGSLPTLQVAAFLILLRLASSLIQKNIAKQMVLPECTIVTDQVNPIATQSFELTTTTNMSTAIPLLPRCPPATTTTTSMTPSASKGAPFSSVAETEHSYHRAPFCAIPLSEHLESLAGADRKVIMRSMNPESPSTYIETSRNVILVGVVFRDDDSMKFIS
ncbi:hypothetical protein B566_EDAN009437 [Ephemera danica]|nr:hypothetical protein B566_EDAN009437 [Ephemera danica]